MSVHVLIVEDDSDLRDSLDNLLTGSGFKVRALRDARYIERELTTFPADVVLLDVNLPGLDGFEAAGHLKERPGIGIIMLTGRTRREDRLQGLSVGADHYVTKPVDPQELELLIRNLARRLAGPRDTAPAGKVGPGRWVFLTARWSLIAPGGASVSLSAAEHHLLNRLTERAGEPVARTALISDVRRPSEDTLGRGLDLIVFRLRRKVQTETGEALPIASARSIGYVFTGPVTRDADMP